MLMERFTERGNPRKTEGAASMRNEVGQTAGHSTAGASASHRHVSSPFDSREDRVYIGRDEGRKI